MRRLALMTAVLSLGIAGVAAGLSYEPGVYNVDPCATTTARPCSNDRNGKLRMVVRRGYFNVRRISLTERCDNGVRSFRGKVTFVSGPNAKLAGRIGREGRFRDRYESPAGFFRVIGVVQGRRLRLDVTEGGSFTREGEPTFHCSGSITFFARRS